jgi:hypothetical protein
VKKALPLVVAASLLLAGCAEDRVFNSKTYPAYGLINQDSNRSANACYEISFGSVVMAAIFIESFIIPVYIIGWDLWQATRLRQSEYDHCGLDH